MRVSNGMAITDFLFNINRSEEANNKIMNKISTGKKIQKPSDDPIGAARSISLNSSLNEVEQYKTNSENAVTWLNVTDDALSNVNANLQRAYELVISGASSDKSESSRKAMAEEIDQIKDGLLLIANTSLDNRYIFAGEEVLDPAYSLRTPVTGNTIDVNTQPVSIDLNNNQFKVKLGDDTIKTIALTPGVYDGTPGKTLTDLEIDIQNQLNTAGFKVPVHVRATPDNQLILYAGPKPSDGVMYSLVLKEGEAIKTTGYTRIPAGTVPPDELRLAADANGIDNYYNGWTLTITGGTGVGQIRTITDYDGTSNTATIDSDWGIIPDTTSTYSLIPPLEGTSTGAGVDTLTIDPAAASEIDDFYVGMTLTIINGPGAGEARQVTNYDQATGVVTVDSPWATPPTGSTYIFTPVVEGRLQGGGANTITLSGASSEINDFYNGASITIENVDGSVETKKIIAYDGVTKVATVDTAFATNPTNTSDYSINDTALAQLGFEHQANSKELVGSALQEPILVIGKYPTKGMTETATANSLVFSETDAKDDNYYNNWTISIVKGTGTGQTKSITAYDSATQTATLDSNWDNIPDATSEYALIPPREGVVPAISGLDEIQLTNASEIDDFYVGMPITLTDGTGVGQTREIIAYDGATQTATLDSVWNVLPDSTSSYSIDTNHYVNANNKFKITLGLNPTQEISLDGGEYSVKDLAKEIESRIQARGGNYANVQVSATPDQELRLFYRDPDPDDNDEPLSIKLESGSSADIIMQLGFNDGAYSDTAIPNYEGDRGIMDYEISQSTQIEVNTLGDSLFDPIFEHLTKISQNLKTGNSLELTSTDIKNIKADIERVLLSQGECGAKVKRLENNVERLDIMKESVTRLISDVEDTDIPEAVMELQTRQLAYEMALKIGAKIIPPTLMDYIR